ncbi:MAG TPA: shikimate kinase [Tepidisphaeraceae bacterium]|nr:shikimate kinase [Tepidisphaeraceae bacterium]
MSVVLIGYRGSGKTTVGRLLAQQLGRLFVDADDLIVKKAGKSIREIFLTGGEEEFRNLEMRVIARLCEMKDCVIALGGGAVLRKENQQALAQAGHRIVYLRCEAGELLRRIQGDPATSDNRPNLTNLGGGIEEIEAILKQREPIYRSVMSAELDVTGLTPRQAAERLAKMIVQD